jgi:hypothetical protein
MIGEVASTEVGGSKAPWIKDALIYKLPLRFPGVKAIVWFNWNVRDIDWAIESSPAAQKAFAQAIASNYYDKNRFADLDVSPIPPADKVPTKAQWRSFFFPILK